MLTRSIYLFVILLSVLGCVNSTTKPVEESSRKGAVAQITPSSDTTRYITIMERNLGSINEGEVIEGAVNISTSSAEVEIFEMKGTCGCMTLTNPFESITKDEVKSLKYIITTSGKNGEEYFDIIINSSIGKFIIEMKAIVKN